LESGALEPLEVEGVNEDIEVVLTYRKRSVVSPVAHAIVEVLREMAVKD
jgi:hypothetical protein